MISVWDIDSDNIRAAIGITDKEVSDAQITSLMIEDQLKIDVLGVYPDHAVLRDAQGSGPTPEQMQLYSILKLWEMYQGAVLMLPEIQFLSAQKISDGDFEQARFIPDNLQESIDRITAQRDKYAALLQAAAGIELVAANPLVLIGISTPNYDPVTNEGA